ncbi:uncharacterized protein LOC128241913 [Mya arenaria]|uniref:uncharacterized protein LOC128241913 n=1 Tax=Mya arenaria TaxID=6604 RepID=UPI0022E4CC3C|nr:uncharacterized protein LOC128241913 [Mya arenaria]
MGLQIKSRYEQLYCNLLWCFVAIFISGNVEGTCTPSDVTNDLQRCFRIQDIGWYYQFPIGHGSSFYKNLCANSTCMSYCLQEVASACVSYDFMTVLGNGSSLVAAYVGLCEQSQTDVQAFLECGKDIDNQVALDSISDYQIKLESYFTNSNENATAILTGML